MCAGSSSSTGVSAVCVGGVRVGDYASGGKELISAPGLSLGRVCVSLVQKQETWAGQASIGVHGGGAISC